MRNPQFDSFQPYPSNMQRNQGKEWQDITGPLLCHTGHLLVVIIRMVISRKWFECLVGSIWSTTGRLPRENSRKGQCVQIQTFHLFILSIGNSRNRTICLVRSCVYSMINISTRLQLWIISDFFSNPIQKKSRKECKAAINCLQSIARDGAPSITRYGLESRQSSKRDVKQIPSFVWLVLVLASAWYSVWSMLSWDVCKAAIENKKYLISKCKNMKYLTDKCKTLNISNDHIC